MKIKNIAKLATLVTLTGLLASCIKKDIAPFNSNHLKVTFNKVGPKYVTQDITVNGGDSIQFNYTVTSDVPMKYINILKNDGALAGTVDTIKGNASKTTFTGTRKLVADVAPGVYTYRINAKDDGNIYLGTSASIKVTVVSDFNYFTYRQFMPPDTVAKTNNCYYSTSTDQLFSYSTVGNNSAKIDFGYYYDPEVVSVVNGTTTTLVPNGHTFYALNSTAITTLYDISAFTKNATLFKVPATSFTFNGVSTSITFANITSGALLQALGTSTFASGATTKINHLAASNATLATGTPVLTSVSLFMFKTVAGKYGIVSISYVSPGGSSKSTFMNVEIKVQK